MTEASRPMRIGITCYPSLGGSGVIASEIGQRLARRGHHVHFVASDVPARLDADAPNVRFHRVEPITYPLLHHTPYTLTLASKLAEVAQRERLDLLHVHYAVPHAASAFLARAILGGASPRVVTTLHGTDVFRVGADPGLAPITRFSVERSDRVTAPSEYLRRAAYEVLAVAPSTAIEVIPNFVDVDRFRPGSPDRGALLGPLFDLPASDLSSSAVLIHVSNFRPIKRTSDVIEIVARIARERPSLAVLVGDGPEREAAERLVEARGLRARVWFTGRRTDFLELLQTADLFLLPSEAESFGVAALEAMSCGVPVVGSAVGGLPEVVRDGETGFLSPVGDAAAMAAHALRLLDDSGLRRAMSAAARAWVVRTFPPDLAVARYEQLYRALLA